MKKLSKLFIKSSILFVMATFCFVSCSNTDTQNNESQSNEIQTKKIVNNENTPAVSASIDGIDWQSSPNGSYSPVEVVALSNTSQNINIQAYGSDKSYMSLNVMSASAIEVNTDYTSASGFFHAQYKPDFMELTSFMSLMGSGTIRFSNINNKNIVGTFSFNGVNPSGGSILVENGTFNIKL